jgi:magnesium transporter
LSTRRAVARVEGGGSEEIDPADIDGLLKKPGTVLWLDIDSPDPADIRLLDEEFGFHELALEDAIKRGQRPKVDEYDDYYFIVLYSARVTRTKRIETHEIHCFWGSNYLVTLHRGRVAEIDTAIHRWQTNKEFQEHGVAYQVYALLDAVIDTLFPALDAITERISDLEDELLSGKLWIMQRALELRREMLHLRRVLGPSRDVLNVLVRRDIPIFPAALSPYFTDVHDHAMRAVESMELQRDFLGNVIDAQLSLVSNRLNQSMLRLTAITVCFMVPAVVTGLYGMNFQYMPELSQPWGYPYALGLIAALVAAAIFAFRRIGWL